MPTIVSLLRHGRAAGQGAEAPLLPEGAEYVGALGKLLAAEGWRPAAAFSSPLTRAGETARIVLAATAPGLVCTTLAELLPEADPAAALDALLARGLPEGRTLVVAHMPLLARLADQIAGELLEFYPGTLAELELGEGGGPGTLVRRIGPEEMGAA
ncbi:MAG TPA: phosphoglycerate mutase family protein [Candidatus Acidoferrales bacterium]|nr:phosphoglycerate mutase family protein [Candidatus Acidoferrales bacterium]